ncbi:hypothetical protein GGF37_001563 [Kickxella alabastrina]|nr:hypothetical protein GGF37_001563 [Kickxella alabastrina]
MPVMTLFRNPLNFKQKRMLGKIGGLIRRGRTYKESRVEEYPELTFTGFSIDYDELRETVRSVWRKRTPADQHKLIAFVIPRGEVTASDYYILSHGDYQNLLIQLNLKDSNCVFYELEDGYFQSLNNSSTASNSPVDRRTVVFNEYNQLA